MTADPEYFSSMFHHIKIEAIKDFPVKSDLNAKLKVTTINFKCMYLGKALVFKREGISTFLQNIPFGYGTEVRF